MNCIKVFNQREMEELAKRLSTLLGPGDVICLTGDLGAGKTTFTQALAKGLGVDEYVTSPTFTLIQEYEGRLPLYHFDVYRIQDVSEMEDIGYEEYFYGKGITVIEWASLIEEILPPDKMWIEIQSSGFSEREICFNGTNTYYEKMIKELLNK